MSFDLKKSEFQTLARKSKVNIHYAWLILFFSFVGLLAVQGIRLSFGAFIQPWEKQFSVDRGTISSISMISFVFYGLSQPIVGKLIDRFGVRKIVSISTIIVGLSIFASYFVTSIWQLFILYGVIASIGFGGVSNVTTTVVITNWFSEKRGLVFGIMEAGAGAGQMLLVPSSLILIERFGWKHTVVYFGLFLLLVIFPALLIFLRNSPSDKGLQAYGGSVSVEENKSAETTVHKSLSIKSVAKLREFWFLALPFFVCGITTTGLMDTHLIPYSNDHGLSTSVTGITVSLLAAFNIIGILLSGILADKVDSRIMLGVLYGTRSLALLILVYSNTPSLFFIFAIVFGLVDFATVAPTQLLATHYFKDYSVGFVLGLLFLGHQIGSALGSYIPGLLYSLSGNYHLSIISSIGLCVVASVLCFMLPKLNNNN